MLLIAGGVVILATIYLLVKQYETRMVLFGAGMVMAIIAGEPMGAFKSFSNAMHEYKLFEPIITVMGFSVVMKVTECDKHLIHLLAKGLQKAGPLLIPGAAMATFAVNTSLTSAAGVSAAAGAIIIPLLLSAGVHPAVAGAAVFAGTYGSMLNPGYSMNVIIADVSKADPMAIVGNHFFPVLVAGLISAFTLLAVAYLKKEHTGYESELSRELHSDKAFHINYLKAFMPLFPLVLLLTINAKLIPGVKSIDVSHTMIIGVMLTLLVTRQNPGKISKEFFHGFGDAFGHIFGIIACALVFVSGMSSLGLIRALTDAMIANPQIAKLSSAYGPFLLAVMSGSGDAAATAFNKAVTINAAQFGITPMDMGSTAALAGGIGRAMSPIAGACIICAGFSGTSPIEVAKRNIPGMILAVTVSMIMMLYLK